MKGDLDPIEGRAALDDAALRALLREIVSAEQWAEYEARRRPRLRLRRSSGVARFRANYFVQQNGAGAVFRIIPEQILTARGARAAAGDRASSPTSSKGLVLVTGPTGSGKSTTLAAIIDQINTSYRKHIVTIEDPVEFVHQNKKSVLSHREVGTHTAGLRRRRCAPRSARTPTWCWSARCATARRSRSRSPRPRWACSCSARCTPTARAKTIDRIIDAFPAEEQNQVRHLALRVARRRWSRSCCVPTADGKGRVRGARDPAAHAAACPNIIREGNTRCSTR